MVRRVKLVMIQYKDAYKREHNLIHCDLVTSYGYTYLLKHSFR